MVTSIARQSVIIKCSMQASVLTGNYEYYYAAGLAAKLAGLSLEEEIQPKELASFVAENFTDAENEDARARYLFTILKDYSPTEEYDGQMRELLSMGLYEERVWEMQAAG